MDYLSEVRIENLNTMTVASASRISTNPEDELIAYMTKWAEESGIANSRRFGSDFPVTEDEQNRGLRGYEYWVSVDENVLLPNGMTLKKVEGCKYAILRITDPMNDPFERIPMGWKKLADWVNSKGFKTSSDNERHWFEEVLEIDRVVYMDLYFPIE
ncbi:effector binding domain-containing protein [Paenibacillus aquistagni]|uniref:effector binding domain-containing protein n=1 Tax=Paenibacillus aquistagni TaxID=1852522 RepID=UPI00145AA1FA|nr:effector binding domain-containing protein [Paenibacillus aquistagni]NMM52919.1 GyrI-like domain-containing protein [Paenibacillus aquistagni]